MPRLPVEARAPYNIQTVPQNFGKSQGFRRYFMIQAILFDFNGVIIDDEPLQLQVYRDVLGAHAITITDEDYYSLLGADDEVFVRAIFERAGKPLKDETLASLIERKSELHREVIGDAPPLFPGVVTFIRAGARRYHLAVVSMARRVEIDYVLGRAHLKAEFKAIVSAEDVAACKPDPCCYNRAFELLNEKRRTARELPLLPHECLVIEDSPPGIQSGRAAGMRTLGVTNTVSEEKLRAAGADVVTRSLADWTMDAVHHVFSEGRN
ncbi:MAG TPA: HAD family phosphatase [Pyrinomonadaceae bacterium]|jgi:HAD superfamily hydrolase (TIGR01509 family)|nr:HAD family phosphatase [Pyrinomonadaceae bacterium]